MGICKTYLGLMNKTMYRTMVLHISSCWFYIINSLSLFVRAIALHIFRIRIVDRSLKDDSCVSAMMDSKGLEPLLEAIELEERDYGSFGEEETSNFSFKFRYQFSGDTMRTSGEPANPVTQTADIRKYCFLPDKDLCGFIKEPDTMTLCVQEPYSESSEYNMHGKEKLDTDFTTGSKDLQQFNDFSNSSKSEESEDELLLKKKLLEDEIPIDSHTNSSAEKNFGGFMEGQEPMIFQVQSYVEYRKGVVKDKEKVYTEFTNRLLPAKDFQQNNSFSNLNNELVNSNDVIQSENKFSDEEIPMDSETGLLDEKGSGSIITEREAMMFRDRDSFDSSKDNEEKLDTEFTTGFLLTKDFKQSNDVLKFNRIEESKDNHLDEELSLSSGTNSLDKKLCLDGIRFLSESFSDFDSDIESVSAGYSVKDLAFNLDSDGFLSERDFNEHENESDTTEVSVDSNGYEAELPEDIGEFDHHLPLLDNSGTECADARVGFVYGKNWSNYEDFSKGSPPKREFCGSRNKPDEKLHTLREVQLPCSNALQMEFTESSNSRHSSFRTDSTRLSISDEVFLVKDFTCSEAKPRDLGGEEAGIISGLQCSDTEFDASISRISALTNESEQVDATLLRRYSEVMSAPEDLRSKRLAPEADRQKSEETQLDTEDLDELESLWEHQFLIEQLKMELRKVRAIGLPTILEESESPKTSEDLKPWKIDEKFSHEDPMDELHKFYKIYRERMRRLDILNYQKMYAIGFLQLKDPLQSICSQKPLIPTIMAHLSQSFLPFFRQKSGSDPSEKFLKELQSDLETVYVGQTCLSWEFLRWQYEKARGLPESDPYRSHLYNQVAGEFQQFQVIIQRFIENESFQGPRLPNYVKNRCVLRNLLQVPVIKEDCLKDKMEASDAITSEMLEDIMLESTRIFWEFVKADKIETPLILKSFIGAQVELQDPSDIELMMDVQAILQKKEKRLKDILRTGNCLVNKLKKPQENRINQDIFISQVDLKLVSMVLKMSRIATEQLVWCHKKLNKITFTDRKIKREPSILLFPC